VRGQSASASGGSPRPLQPLSSPPRTLWVRWRTILKGFGPAQRRLRYAHHRTPQTRLAVSRMYCSIREVSDCIPSALA
jgi:hypothetical protein